MLTTTIRRMAIEDILQVFQIDVLSSSLPWSERSYRFEITQNATARLWVAEINPADTSQPKIVGFLVIWFIVDEAHIANIAVHPDYRQMHIGQNLLQSGLISACEEGAKTAYLEVRRGNLQAQNLYRKFGFLEDGIRPRYYRDNHEDAVLMSLQHMSLRTLAELSVGSNQ